MKIISAIVRGLIALLFIYYLVAFVWSVAGRVTYPYNLEYYEGSTYLHTQRLIEGKQLYVDPNEGFIPYPYTPLYYVAVIPFTWVFGQNIIAGRAATLFSLAIIGLFTWLALFHSTRSRIAGLFAFGMFLALYYIGGGWLDICRIDLFFCMLLMGSVYFLKDFPSKKSGLIPSAIFLIASVFAKQVGIVFIIFIFPFLYTRDKKSACIYFLAVLATIAAITLILNSITGGWFWRYIYEVPQHRQFYMWRFLQIFLLGDIVGRMPILFIGSILWIFVRNMVSSKRTSLNIWEWTLPAAFLASALPRSQPGGFENNLLPIFLWCSIMFGFFLYHLPGYFERLIGSSGTPESRRHWMMWRLIAYNFLLAQLILIFYIPTAQGFPRNTDYSIIPTREDRVAGDNLMAYLRSFPGDVYLPVQNYYAWKAGKTPNLIITAATEYLKAGGKQPELIYNQIQSRSFDAIILNDPIPPRREAMSYERAIQDNYYWAGDVPYEGKIAFYPPTGLPTRPNIVMLPLGAIPEIKGRLAGQPVPVTRFGQKLQACLMDDGGLYLVDPVKFEVAAYRPTPFVDAKLVGATDDGRIGIMTADSIYLVGDGVEYQAVPLPPTDYPPQSFQVALDPLGQFIIAGDNTYGRFSLVDIATGTEIKRWRVGSPIGRVIISPDASRLYLTVGESLSPIHEEASKFGALYCYDILREGPVADLGVGWSLNWPYRGREIRLSPDGERLYWFNPKDFSPIGVFNAKEPALLFALRARGWRVCDIAFGEGDNIYVHYAMPEYSAVSILDTDSDTEYGRARFYDIPGWIVSDPDEKGTVLFSAGTGRITHFRIYRDKSWPGEQGFMP